MKRIVLYLLLAFQILGLVALYAWQSQTPGPRYLLQTRPVDPRDLLRGDYVILGYEISTPPKEWRDANPPAGPVFVRLKADGRFWIIDRIATAPDGDEGPWLRARWNGNRLDYGIGKYFVPEGRGNPPGKITVEIVVRTGGEARIVQLYNDDQPWP